MEMAGNTIPAATTIQKSLAGASFSISYERAPYCKGM